MESTVKKPINKYIKKAAGFTDEERKIRVRMAYMGIRAKDIAMGIGITPQDVTAVIRGTSRSPRYVAEVYKFLELEQEE